MPNRTGPSPTAERISAEARRRLERDGPEGVSIRKVARAVGLTAMAIYRHYPSREAMLARVVDDVFAELAAAWSGAQRRRRPRAARLRLRRLPGLRARPPAPVRLRVRQRAAGRPSLPARLRGPPLPDAEPRRRRPPAGHARGPFRRGDPWPIALSLWALSHGLVSLYRGGRIDLPRARLHALHRAALLRHLDGLAR